MAVIKRSRDFPVAPHVLWRTLSDPKTQNRWWPGVMRVEGVSRHGFTQVSRSSRGVVVRSDFLRSKTTEPELLVWTQQLAGTPFASVFAERVIEVRLQPDGNGGSTVTLVVTQELKGAARYMPLNRGGVKRQLDAALDGLAELAG